MIWHRSMRLYYSTSISICTYLKILQKVSVGHPEAAVVEGLGIELATDRVGNVRPPGVLGVPSANPVNRFRSGAILHPNDLATLAQIRHLGHPVDVPDLEAELRGLSQPHLVGPVGLDGLGREGEDNVAELRGSDEVEEQSIG